MKWLRLIIAWIVGIAATAALFVGFSAAVWWLAFLYFILRHPHDPARNADAGWFQLAVAFYALPIIISLSPLGGFIAGMFVHRKMQPPAQGGDVETAHQDLHREGVPE